MNRGPSAGYVNYCLAQVTQSHKSHFISSETFSFVLTGEDGSRWFGYCKKLLVSVSLVLTWNCTVASERVTSCPQCCELSGVLLRLRKTLHSLHGVQCPLL